MTSSDSKVSKIQTQFQALTSVATSLNTASDELTRIVGVLDEALKKLNIGLTVWVTFCTWSDEYNQGITNVNRYSCEQIGYCKVNGKWGIALQRVSGDDAGPDEPEGPWLYNDAPRDMRLESVDKIPEVIEELSKEASKAAKIIQEKTRQVGEFAAVIEQMTKTAQKKPFGERMASFDKAVKAGHAGTLADLLDPEDKGSK